ncbi:MAG TPA: BatD family protein [Candidatus Ozemobacteraceae bacterium]|nr:BatD family protein [Candidatus Ozemobacteraceae bacterium]
MSKIPFISPHAPAQYQARRCGLAAVWLAAALILMISAAVMAQDIALDAEVDRTTVKFGETLTLTLTLSQAISGTSPGRVMTPNLDSVPNFDVAGRRTSQNMSFVNGVGNLQVQTSLELVPRGPGDFSIPALSLKLPDGRTVSSKAISVKVLPPEDEQAKTAGSGSSSGAAATADDDTARVAERGGMSVFKAISMLLVIVAIVICLPILLSWYMSARSASARHAKKSQDTGMGEAVEEAAIVSEVKAAEPPIDFEREVDRLKREVPETGLEFYRIYFDLYHKAFIASHAKLDAMKTPDELRRAGEAVLPPAVSARLRAVFDAWEGVTYARFVPSRPFAEIHDDARAILRALNHKQETHR